MAEHGEPTKKEHEDDEIDSGYKPPAEKALDTIVDLDADDDALKKYKETLLGKDLGKNACPFPENAKRVIVTKLAILVDGHNDLELDLAASQEKPFPLKEGCTFRVKIYFYVQREIVTGLKYVQKSYRKGINVDTQKNMVGSYGPKNEVQSFTTPPEVAPSGMLARGTYTMKSLFTDDDKHEHLKWEWQLALKKDWE